MVMTQVKICHRESGSSMTLVAGFPAGEHFLHQKGGELQGRAKPLSDAGREDEQQGVFNAVVGGFIKRVPENIALGRQNIPVDHFRLRHFFQSFRAMGAANAGFLPTPREFRTGRGCRGDRSPW